MKGFITCLSIKQGQQFVTDLKMQGDELLFAGFAKAFDLCAGGL